ncbi:P-loop containing nucleoside triphosphate hydrolase protein [Mycena vulgaris]|nr:P-loop containing nucleoside triphosphate hydrolase protein [Mycena vulgaris]
MIREVSDTDIDFDVGGWRRRRRRRPAQRAPERHGHGPRHDGAQHGVQWKLLMLDIYVIFFADPHGSWRWTDAWHKHPMGSIVLDPGVKEMLLDDVRDFLGSEKWYADCGIPFRRGHLLHGVPGSGKSSLMHAIAGELMLDIYVVSLSSAWINDSVLMGLTGCMPKGAIILLEDLDAAFTCSVSRSDDSGSAIEGPELSPKQHSHEEPTQARGRKRHIASRQTNEFVMPELDLEMMTSTTQQP